MHSMLWVRPVDGNGVPTGEARQVNREVTDAPTWSGDSKQLLYLSNGKLRMIGADGSNPRTIPLDLTWRKEEVAPRTVIHAGRLWDGRGAAERTDVDIVIANGRIESVEPHRERPGAGTKLVDASNLTVIPGLWESHTHEWISGKFYGDRLGRLWLAYGVTELQSQGDPAYRAVETREAFASGERIGPRYFASGEALDGERVYYNFMRPIMSEAQLDLELSRAQALDYDLLKTYVRLPHAMQKKAMKFAHGTWASSAASHYMLPGMAYGMDGMTHVSATARLGFAYTRSSGGVSYQDMRSLFEASGMFDISTAFASSPLYAEDPAMVKTAPAHAQYAVGPGRAAGEARRWRRARSRWCRRARTCRAWAIRPQLSTRSARKWRRWAPSSRHGGTMLVGTDSPLDSVATALAPRPAGASQIWSRAMASPADRRPCFRPGPSTSKRISAPWNPASWPIWPS